MEQSSSHANNESAWRNRLLRHEQSGKSIAAFCRDEAVSTASFHIWRSKLAAVDSHIARPTKPTGFLDLGAIAAKGATSDQATVWSPTIPAHGIDIRIDLGGGVVLTLTRR